jgi:hypothetical protein
MMVLGVAHTVAPVAPAAPAAHAAPAAPAAPDHPFGPLTSPDRMLMPMLPLTLMTTPYGHPQELL